MGSLPGISGKSRCARPRLHDRSRHRQDLLRIFHAHDDGLLDRVEVRIAALHAISATFSGEPEPSSFYNLPDLPVALFADAGASRAVLALRSANGSRLFDQTLDARALSGGAVQRDGAWDVVQASPDPAATTLRLEVRAGGSARPLDIPLARQLTRIDAAPFVSELKNNGFGQRLCFQAVASGHRVAGIPWILTASPGITVRPDSLANGCADISAAASTAVGPASVTAQVGTTTRTVEFTVVAALAATAAETLPVQTLPAEPPAVQPATLGDRAVPFLAADGS